RLGESHMKRNILVVFLVGMTLFAAFLGWYAQDIAYYFEKHLFYQAPFKTLIVVTITSVALFIILFVIHIMLLGGHKEKPRIYIILLITNIFIGFFTSLWSLFVLAMWWG